jgi:CheY-like chemotaxis protein
MDLHQAGILIIDDFLDMRQALVRMVHQSGFRLILESENAQRALPLIKKMYNEHQLAAIIVDLHMPGMGGYELFKALQLDPELKALPIILLGDARDTQHLKDLKHKGIYDYFLKPLDQAAIVNKLRHLMKNSEKRVA